MLKVNSLFMLVSYAAMNEYFFLFLLTLDRPVRSQPVNLTGRAVFTSRPCTTSVPQ